MKDFSGAEASTHWDATVGYRDILKHVAEYGDEAEAQERTAKRLADVDPESAWSDYGYAVAALNRGEIESAIAHVNPKLRKFG